MMYSLKGKVAAMTGAGNGIGRSKALLLARRGAAVVVDVSRDNSDAVVPEIVATGGHAVANYADVSEWKSGHAMVQRAEHQFGGLDVVVTNPALSGAARSARSAKPTSTGQMSILFKGTYALVHHAAAYWNAARGGTPRAPDDRPDLVERRRPRRRTGISRSTAP
jgi:NAD(P)-dependent dehydrogenase (short-subunit alcohol dehydrogenase family)